MHTVPSGQRRKLFRILMPYDPGPTLALDKVTVRLTGAGLSPRTATGSALKMLGSMINRYATT